MAENISAEQAATGEVRVRARRVDRHVGIVSAGETVCRARRSARLHRMALHEWTVAGGLIETDAGVLLVRNVRRGGFEDWSTPGGVIDADDADLLAGLTREVDEETGLDRARVARSALRGARARARHGLADALRGAPRGRVRRRAPGRRSRRHRGRGARSSRRTNVTSTSSSCAPWVREPLERVAARTVGAARAARLPTTRSTARRATRCAWYAVPRPEREMIDAADPARRSRRVLRVGRAARRPDASRPARDRRRARRPGGGRGRELRSPQVRGALGDADGPGPAGVSRRRCSCRRASTATRRRAAR